MNIVTQTGYLGAIPEVKEIGEVGKEYTVLETTLFVKTTQKIGADYERIPITCKVSGQVAKYLGQYATKGSHIAITGEMRIETWEKEGKKVYKHVVKVKEAEILDTKEQTEIRRSKLTQ